jgi:hypothetical protein
MMFIKKRLCGLIFGVTAFASVSAMAEDMKFDWSSIRPDVTLQPWLVNDTTSTNAKPNFVMRRAEIRFAGNVGEGAHWFVMGDLAKALSASGSSFYLPTDRSVLQDIGVSFKLIPGMEITAGQFKTLTSSEGLEKDGELLLPERSIVGRAYGERREPGAMLTYKFCDRIQAGAMVSNGKGANADDVNGSKDLTARVDADINDMVRVGAFTRAADFGYNIDGNYGANVRLVFGSLLVSAEGALGNMASVKSAGGQGTVAYSITPKIQPVFRFETFSPNTAADAATAETIGVNYYVSGNYAKVQVAYSNLNNLSAPNGFSQYANGSTGSNLWVVFQAGL